MATVINTKLGENRGKKRLWLEGAKLEREGYLPGTRYDVMVKETSVILRVSEHGRFLVSRRDRAGKVSPIIDLQANELAALFDGVAMLRVAIRRGSIVVSAHEQHGRVKERVQRLADKIRDGKPLAVCSLFHGGGVLDKALHHGLAEAGVSSQVAVAVEMEAAYLDSSLRNNPELWADDSIVIESPIQSVSMRRNPAQVDILVGGIPCTGASKAGKAKNKLAHAESHEGAGAMFFNFLHFVDALNPAVVIIENVPDYQGTASMEVIRSVLKTLGYETTERVLAGDEFGALEKRRRLCVVGVSKGMGAEFDLLSVPTTPVAGQRVCDILDRVPDDSERWRELLTWAKRPCGTNSQGRDSSGNC